MIPRLAPLLLAAAAAAPFLPPPVAQEPGATEAKAWPGAFVPAPEDAAAVEIWPESWSGEWLILEAAPHGSWVNEGQVLARFEDRAFREAVERGQQELEDARLEQRLAAGRVRVEQAADEERLGAAEAALERARESFEAWRDTELPMRREQAALADLFSAHGIADQEDELAQLEAMYGADELTDATEELVLMRARRNLARSRVQQELARRQRELTERLTWAHEDREKGEALQRQAAALERQRATLEMDAAARRQRLEKGERELQRKERDFARLREDGRWFELHAPRSGMLLHGALADYEPGHTPPRHERGGRAPTRRAMFTIAGGSRWRVALELGDADRVGLTPGAGVTVQTPAAPDLRLAGRIEVEAFPTARSSGGEQPRYTAAVVIDGETRGIAPGMRAEVRAGAR